MSLAVTDRWRPESQINIFDALASSWLQRFNTFGCAILLRDPTPWSRGFRILVHSLYFSLCPCFFASAQRRDSHSFISCSLRILELVRGRLYCFTQLERVLLGEALRSGFGSGRATRVIIRPTIRAHTIRCAHPNRADTVNRYVVRNLTQSTCTNERCEISTCLLQAAQSVNAWKVKPRPCRPPTMLRRKSSSSQDDHQRSPQ